MGLKREGRENPLTRVTGSMSEKEEGVIEKKSEEMGKRSIRGVK